VKIYILIAGFFLAVFKIDAGQTKTNQPDFNCGIEMKTMPPAASLSSDCRTYNKKIFSIVDDKWKGLLEETNSLSHDRFEEVTVTFDLYSDGKILNLAASENTNSELTAVCLKAVKNSCPFPKWTDQMQLSIKQNYWTIKFHFILNLSPPLPN
jgi:hypothetical protein